MGHGVATLSSGELRRLRERLALTQEELAERLAVPALAVSNWETDQGSPSQEAVLAFEKIADSLLCDCCEAYAPVRERIPYFAETVCADCAWEFLGRERLVAYLRERLFFVSWPRVAEMPEETANITVLRRFKRMRGAQAHARSRTKEMVAIDPEGAALGLYSYEVCSEERGRLP